MDFFQICTRETKGGATEVYPDFTVGRSKDLMVRGRAFYAIWDEEQGLWSTDEYDVQRLVDDALYAHAEELKAKGTSCKVKYLRSFDSNSWNQFRRYVGNVSDNSHQLDENLTFANTPTKKGDYVSRKLPYSLIAGEHHAWDELVSHLYGPEERAKIEWAIGSIVAGDSKKLQKFLVLYGPGGTGKSTVLNIVQKLFDGYAISFEAKALAVGNNAFSTEIFKSNPLVAIQHDGDLSKIEDNTKLNSIISHEDMTMNEKYKPSYTARILAFLFMGTNKPVRISDAKSGLIRRLIDVRPTGDKFAPNHYHSLMSQIDFELGAIAYHCLEVYREMGKNYYNAYRPLEMMLQTDVFFNFIEAHYDIFKGQDGTTLKQAYSLYKEYCADTGVEWVLPQYKMREELRNYFSEFQDRATVDGATLSSYFSGFIAQPFKAPVDEDAAVFSLVMDETISLLDLEYADLAAQYAKEDGTPQTYWANVKTRLAEIDISQEHYVRPPENHIVIDFDLKDEDGRKSLERNLSEASGWPATYAELSRGGNGVHLHYIWSGEDIGELHNIFSDGIEIKTFGGNAALRRRVSRCNNVPIATINSGLPLKEKKMLQTDTIKSEKGLRDLIARNLRKEIHAGTKPSIDFIQHILEEAYLSGVQYNVTDLRPRIVAFANNSSNQPLLSLKVVQRMRFKSEEIVEKPATVETTDERLVFFDVEVYPNLFLICWKYQGSPTTVRMRNPSPQEVEALFKMKLVGFNNRRYDNHIIYARYLGYDNEQLFRLSEKIINGNVASMFGEAYNLSHADVYDYSSKKQGLKKFQIELRIPHKEMDIPWSEPIPTDRIQDVEEYCVNDVTSLEVVFEDRKQDYVARQILAELSGLTMNDTTAKHTARIIFGQDRNPQKSFIYTQLDKEFPSYTFEKGVSTYREEVVGEGGYVYAEPGMHQNVALLDVASMHPTSIQVLDLFGPEYTRRFAELTEARMAIKHKDYDRARTLLNGRLAKYLDSPEVSVELAYALKIVINIVYGLTSAKFDNAFRDIRNVDNIAAKRGALFMIDLKHAIQEQGFSVAHIKTDSVKIPDATQEIIDFVMNFGDKYGYKFEHEATYDKFCLVNDAVYIARKTIPAAIEGDNKNAWTTNWTAVGAQFQQPYVYKSLFTHEDIDFEDLCETKQVTQGAIYMDFDGPEKPMHFVGRTGRFVPVAEGMGGATLYRIKEDKQYAVAGTKGYLWLEADVAKAMGDALEVDMRYFEKLAEEAWKTIDHFGPFAEFTS